MPRSEAADHTATSSLRSIALGVGALVLCWMLLMPPGSGPDEPGHLVRSGAVIRWNTGEANTYALPDRYQVAEPGCYAFQPTVPVTCSSVPQHSGAELELPTRAGEYPVWGHAVFGVLTVLPGLDPIWWARLAGGLIAATLMTLSLARTTRHAPVLTGGLLLGVTPMAWSTFGTVNPSSIVIAGSVALWIGLLVHERPSADVGGTAMSSAGWLTAIGWAALVLPRRDGLVWACLTLTVALAATGRPTLVWWRSLGRGPQIVIAAPTVTTMVWGALSDSRSTQFVVVAPLIVLAAEAVRWWWHRPAHTPGTRIAGVVVAGVVGALAVFVVINTRPGGWDTDLALEVVMQTDDNLVEAIGVLGWLDTVVPAGAVYVWLIALGMLVTAALMSVDGRTAVLWAAVLASATAASSWILELVQGNTSGQYWQGRYSVPLLVGVPLLLTYGLRDRRERRLDTVAASVGLTGLVILNVGAWAAARRFGVGLSGSYLPWRWDTAIQPVPPVLILVAHAAASAWLAHQLLWVPRVSPAQQG